MAIFQGRPKVVAGDINSEAATDGQVLTADGAGNAAWEDAGGGASFVWDGATIAVGEWQSDEGPQQYYLSVTFTPMLGGETVETGNLLVRGFIFNLEEEPGAYTVEEVSLEPTSSSLFHLTELYERVYAFDAAGGPLVLEMRVLGAFYGFRIVFIYPTGGIYYGNALYRPE